MGATGIQDVSLNFYVQSERIGQTGGAHLCSAVELSAYVCIHGLITIPRENLLLPTN